MNRIEDIVNQLNNKDRMDRIYQQNEINRKAIEERIRKQREEEIKKAEIREKRKIARIRWQRRKNNEQQSIKKS